MNLRSRFAVVVLFAGLSALLLWPGLYAGDRKDPKADPKPGAPADA